MYYGAKSKWEGHHHHVKQASKQADHQASMVKDIFWKWNVHQSSSAPKIKNTDQKPTSKQRTKNMATKITTTTTTTTTKINNNNNNNNSHHTYIEFDSHCTLTHLHISTIFQTHNTLAIIHTLPNHSNTFLYDQIEQQNSCYNIIISSCSTTPSTVAFQR